MSVGDLHSFLLEQGLQMQQPQLGIPCTADAKPNLIINATEFLRVITRKNADDMLRVSIGDYQLLARLITEEVDSLLQQNFTLSFVFDGQETENDNTKHSLLRAEHAKYEKMEYQSLVIACQNGYSKKQLPVPVLGALQLEDMLRRMIRTLPNGSIALLRNNNYREIYQFMVELCETSGADEGAVINYILSDDSLFFPFKGCMCVRFDEMYRIKAGTGSGPTSVAVWSRGGIARALGLSESKFVEFCLVFGNIAIPSSLRNDAAEYILHLIGDIREAGDGEYRARSDEQRIGLCMEYCRCLFERGDLCAVSLYEDLSDTAPRDDNDTAIALSDATLGALVDLLEIENCSEFGVVANYAASICASISSSQQAALVNTISLISEKDSSASHQEARSELAVPSWENCHSGIYFQLLYKEWRRYVSEVPNVSSPGDIPSPAEIFSCDVYIKELKSIEMSPAPMTYLLKAPILTTSFGESGGKGTDPKSNKSEALPIDAHRLEILAKVASDRVVMIHGETGCGKSTRLPLFVYEDCIARGSRCKVLIAQPRRIAALNVYRRLKSALGGDVVGLRMGQGVVEGQDSAITLLTTGKLLRYLSGNLLHRCTHVIIDEVHERSIDNDLVCMFVRDLLLIHPTIKVILMSATIQYTMYQNYFSSVGYFGDMRCLSVGVKRFPVRITYAEEIGQAGHKIIDTIDSFRGQFDDSKASMLVSRQYAAVDYIVKNRVRAGSGVLVFVAGMQDINELYGLIEESYTNSRTSRKVMKYKVYVIHRDVPLEEQEEAFLPAHSDEVKVVLATNAAESSITIPDVDVVIDMGMHKTMLFDDTHNRSYLRSTFISKASAAQRAGRTGRTRPGEVYRLYSRNFYDMLDEHPTAEVRRIPMQDVIIRLRFDFEKTRNFKGVVPILCNLLEPPSVKNIDSSFQNLYQSGMITEASDEGRLTSLGSFCSGLSMDIQLGKLIAFGALFGVEEEAIIMSSALSLQKSIFRVASSFVQKNPDDLNRVVSENFFAASYLDGGCYSEPIMYLRLLLLYEEQPREKQKGWLVKHGLSVARFYHFRNWTIDCLRRVKGCLKGRSEVETSERPVNDSEFSVRSTDLNDTKLNILRLILTWTCDNNIMRQEPLQLKSYESVDEVVIMSPEFSENHLKAILPKSITWSIAGSGNAPRNIRFLTDATNTVIENEERMFSPIIRDAKEGVRLLNSLRSVRREGVSFRRNAGAPTSGPVVGSKTWDRGSRGGDTDNFFALKFRTWNLKWAFYNIQSFGGYSGPVYLPKQSLVSLACPVNGGVLFGVSNKMSEHVTRDGKSVLNAEGVTLLPQGEKWLSLALHCMMSSSSDCGDIYTSSMGSLTRLSNSDVLSKKELRSCISIGKYLYMDSSQPIRRCDEAVAEINALFAGWTEKALVNDRQAIGSNGDQMDSKPLSVFMPPLPEKSGSVDVERGRSSATPSSNASSSSKLKKQLCPWCEKSFAAVRDHIAFVHPDKVAEYIALVGEESGPSENSKSGLTAAALDGDAKEDDTCYYEYLSAVREYYTLPQNKRRMEHLLKYLRRYSKQCIFCRFQHSDDGVVYNSHLPELHALLKTVEQYTGASSFGSQVVKTLPEPFYFENAAEYDKRYENSFSEGLVPMIVNDHLRKVYGIKNDGRFGDKVNDDFRNFLANSRRTAVGNKCQFCSESFPDLPRHLIGSHLPEVHAAIGGLTGAVSKDTHLTSISKDDIMTGTTLIQPTKAPKVSLKSVTSATPKVVFACPKCEHKSQTPLQLADHFGGHFNATFDCLSVKKKAVVKVKSSCPICKDKKLFMQFGQLLDHITGSHPHSA